MNGEIGRDAALSRKLSGVGAARRPYLNVRWLGRMEFARALELQEEIRGEKAERPLARRSAASSGTRTRLHNWTHS